MSLRIVLTLPMNAATISALREDERDYVLNLVKGACDHFRRRR